AVRLSSVKVPRYSRPAAASFFRQTRKPLLMSIYRYLPYVLTVAGLVAGGILLRNPKTRSARADEGPVAPVFTELKKAPAEASARRLVEQAIARLSEPRLTWLETAVWMKSRLPEISCEGEGNYVRGPGGRFRLELRTRVDGL